MDDNQRRSNLEDSQLRDKLEDQQLRYNLEDNQRRDKLVDRLETGERKLEDTAYRETGKIEIGDKRQTGEGEVDFSKTLARKRTEAASVRASVGETQVCVMATLVWVCVLRCEET